MKRVPGLKNALSPVAALAAAALLALTLAALFRASPPNDVELGVLAVAWAAVLGSALVARGRALPEQPRPAASEPTTASLDSGVPANRSGVLLEFARELHATLESDRLRLVIARQLPIIVGRRDVWIVARLGSRQQVIVPSGPGEKGEMALVSDDPRQWATYPMKADGRTIGILGAGIPPAGITPSEHRLFDSLGSMIAQALLTANAFETMRKTSLIDALTGCAMRTEGLRRFRAELRRADRVGTSLAVLMLDLDHFKSINDQFGHQTGDAVLSSLGQILLESLRASDIRCRWGGEEFMLVLPDSTAERARRTSEKLRQRIAEASIRAGDRAIRVTASIGITMTRRGERDLEQCLARADAALYEAKRLGRNRISFVLDGQAPGGSDARSQPGPSAEPSRPEWTGIERRDPGRADRRRFPGPGRRSSDRTEFVGPERIR